MNNLNQFAMQYNEEIAAEADPKGNYIDESGVYSGVINSAVVKLSKNVESKSWWVRIAFTAENGKEATRLDLLMAKSNGDTFYTTQAGKTGTLKDVSILHSVMGLLNIQSLNPIQGKEAIGFREFTGKKIALALQKSLYTKTDGTVGSSLNLIRAFEPQTLKTLTEKKAGTEAKVHNMKIEDEDRTTGGVQPQKGSYSQTTANQDQTTQYDDILPF